MCEHGVLTPTTATTRLSSDGEAGLGGATIHPGGLMPATRPNLGELIPMFYNAYLALYGDEDVAAVAAVVSINEVLAADEARRAATLPTPPTQGDQPSP